MAKVNPHDRSRPVVVDEEDPLEKMLNKSGCLELHYAVQECMADHSDWRKCQKQVQDFKECIDKSKKKQK